MSAWGCGPGTRGATARWPAPWEGGDSELGTRVAVGGRCRSRGTTTGTRLGGSAREAGCRRVFPTLVIDGRRDTSPTIIHHPRPEAQAPHAIPRVGTITEPPLPASRATSSVRISCRDPLFSIASLQTRPCRTRAGPAKQVSRRNWAGRCPAGSGGRSRRGSPFRAAPGASWRGHPSSDSTGRLLPLLSRNDALPSAVLSVAPAAPDRSARASTPLSPNGGLSP